MDCGLTDDTVSRRNSETFMREDQKREREHELESMVVSSFREAYPDVPPDEIEHMARNFTQVLQGLVSIGEKIGGQDVNHMDEANGMVYFCVASTIIEELQEKGVLPDDISEEKMGRMLGECVVRVADWLLGREILKRDEELFRKFVSGAVAMGASSWEKNRWNVERR